MGTGGMKVKVKKNKNEPQQLCARVDDAGHIVELWWNETPAGVNKTTLRVVTEHRTYEKDVNPEMAFYEFTHAGSNLPEAWEAK